MFCCSRSDRIARRRAMQLSARAALQGLGEALSYRLMKIFANGGKGALSALMLAAPRWRLPLPSRLPPRRPALTAQRIPRILWQTNYTDRVAPTVYACFWFNRRIAPSYDYRFFGDEACDRFVAENFPGRVARAFQRLQIGPARADFWRILALLKHGGVYMDIDANFVGDPDRVIPPDAEHIFIVTDEGVATNYFLAAAPGDPALQQICDEIVDNIERGELTSIYHMTGPTVVDRVVRARGLAMQPHRKIAVQGQFTNKKGQYLDKPAGRWDVAEKIGPILGRDE